MFTRFSRTFRACLALATLLLATGSASAATRLYNNAARVGLFGTTGTKQYFYIDVGANATKLVVKTWAGFGDADLYLRKSFLPTTTVFTARSISVGNLDWVTRINPSPGRYYVMVHAYSGYSGLSLRATVFGGSPPPPLPPPNPNPPVPPTPLPPQTWYFYPGTIGFGGWQYYYVDVPAGKTYLKFELNGGSGNADLYYRFGAQPTTAYYGFRSVGYSNYDWISNTYPSPGRHWVMVYAQSWTSGSTLKITVQ